MNAEQFYEHLLTHSFDALAVLNKSGLIKYVSPSIQRILGYEMEELMGKNLHNLIPQEDIVALQQVFYQLDQLNASYTEVALHIKNKAGEDRFMLLKATNQLYHPEIAGIVCNLADITTEKNSHIAVQQYNLFKSFFDSGKDAMLVLDKQKNIIAFNQPAKELSLKLEGKAPQKGVSVMEYVPSDIMDTFDERLNLCLAGETTQVENLITIYEGEQRLWVETTITPIKDLQGEIFSIGVRTAIIQQRKIAAQQLVETQKNLKALFDSSTEIIFMLNKELSIVWLNQAAIQMTLDFFNQPAQIGESILWYSQLSEDKQSILVEHIHQCFEGDTIRIDRKFRGLNNQSIWYQINYTPLYDEHNEVFAVCLGAINITDRKIAEQRLKNLNGQLISQNKELARQETLLKSANQKLMDKQEQLQLAFQELSDRNFELDQLMYKTSHDIRSPLTSILGLINLMKIEGVPTNLNEYVERIETSVARLDKFVTSMLSHAKSSRQEVSPEEIDFKQIIQQSFDSFRYLDNFDKVEKIVEVDTNGYIFRSDLVRIAVIFNNIISNAFKYANTEQERSYLTIEINIFPKKAEIRISDNGIGIDNDYLDKVFDMFFRASEKADGSGLGLYIVKQTVEKLGGGIQVQSELNKGTYIYITLPSLDV